MGRRHVKLTKRITFEAAHRLEDWTWSKCHNLHGHTWHVEVTYEGAMKADGAIIDFSVVGEMLRKMVFDSLDHQYINDVLGIRNATSEQLAMWIWTRIIGHVPVDLKRVRVQETETCWVDYEGD